MAYVKCWHWSGMEHTPREDVGPTTEKRQTLSTKEHLTFFGHIHIMCSVIKTQNTWKQKDYLYVSLFLILTLPHEPLTSTSVYLVQNEEYMTLRNGEFEMICPLPEYWNTVVCPWAAELASCQFTDGAPDIRVTQTVCTFHLPLQGKNLIYTHFFINPALCDKSKMAMHTNLEAFQNG